MYQQNVNKKHFMCVLEMDTEVSLKPVQTISCIANLAHYLREQQLAAVSGAFSSLHYVFVTWLSNWKVEVMVMELQVRTGLQQPFI